MRGPLGEVAKLAGVVLATAAVGVGVVALVSGGGGGEESRAVPPRAAAPALPVTVPGTSRAPDIRVTAAVVEEALLSVTLAVRNGAPTRLALRPALLYSGRQIEIDPEAEGTIQGPLAPGRSATGELHFPLAAADARALRADGRARVRVAGRQFDVPVG